MAEVYIIGDLESADKFGDNRLACYWKLQLGGGWRVVEGETEGQTQTDLPSSFEKAYFSHPIDVHLATKTVQEWPRMHFQMWHFDGYDRQELCGYGSIFVPTTPGEHEVVCHIWRPKGSAREEMMQSFIGGGLQLGDIGILEDPEERAKINAVSMGEVKLRLSIITRHFDRFGILS